MESAPINMATNPPTQWPGDYIPEPDYFDLRALCERLQECHAEGVKQHYRQAMPAYKRLVEAGCERPDQDLASEFRFSPVLTRDLGAGWEWCGEDLAGCSEELTLLNQHIEDQAIGRLRAYRRLGYLRSADKEFIIRDHDGTYRTVIREVLTGGPQAGYVPRRGGFESLLPRWEVTDSLSEPGKDGDESIVSPYLGPVRWRKATTSYSVARQADFLFRDTLGKIDPHDNRFEYKASVDEVDYMIEVWCENLGLINPRPKVPSPKVLFWERGQVKARTCCADDVDVREYPERPEVYSLLVPWLRKVAWLSLARWHESNLDEADGFEYPDLLAYVNAIWAELVAYAKGRQRGEYEHLTLGVEYAPLSSRRYRRNARKEDWAANYDLFSWNPLAEQHENLSARLQDSGVDGTIVALHVSACRELAEAFFSKRRRIGKKQPGAGREIPPDHLDWLLRFQVERVSFSNIAAQADITREAVRVGVESVADRVFGRYWECVLRKAK
jgi:hypothetical protein